MSTPQKRVMCPYAPDISHFKGQDADIQCSQCGKSLTTDIRVLQFDKVPNSRYLDNKVIVCKTDACRAAAQHNTTAFHDLLVEGRLQNDAEASAAKTSFSGDAMDADGADAVALSLAGRSTYSLTASASADTPFRLAAAQSELGAQGSVAEKIDKLYATSSASVTGSATSLAQVGLSLPGFSSSSDGLTRWDKNIRYRKLTTSLITQLMQDSRYVVMRALFERARNVEIFKSVFLKDSFFGQKNLFDPSTAILPLQTVQAMSERDAAALIFALCIQGQRSTSLVGGLSVQKISAKEFRSMVFEGRSYALKISIQEGGTLWLTLPDDLFVRFPMFNTTQRKFQITSVGLLRDGNLLAFSPTQ